MADEQEVTAIETTDGIQPVEEFNKERFIEGKENSTIENEPIKPAEEKSTETVQSDPVYDDYWNTLSKKYGNDYKIPEILKTGKKEDGTELTSEDKFNLLTSEIAKGLKYSNNPNVDSFIRSTLKASNSPDFDLSKHLETLKSDYIDPSSMSLEDKVQTYYKQEFGKIDENDKDGLTDEDIKDEISKLSRTDKIKYAREFDKTINNKLSEQERQYQTKYNTDVDNMYKKVTTEATKLFDNYYNKVKIGKNIDGIELSEADHATFIKESPDFFKKVTKVDSNGYKYITSEVQEVLADLLGSPEKSLTLMPFLWLYKNKKLGGYSNQLKEEVKKNIEEKLSNDPKVNQSNFVGNEFDAEAFKRGTKK